ncbi:MAG: recombinase RecA [Actinomycetota bacterium]|nr:recombinase RecA [Actinomycetota bacterium]
MDVDRAFEQELKDLQRLYGARVLTRLSDRGGEAVAVLPTGISTLDQAIGVGGIPRGRIVEMFGPEGAGKTSLALSVMAEAQRLGEEVLLVDAEHAFDPSWGRRLGMQVEQLWISQPDSAEEALDIVLHTVRSGSFAVVSVDSVAALVPQAELEGAIGDVQVGLQARLMAKALRSLAGMAAKSGTCVIFINQLRERIGGGGYGPSETTPGGRALKFFASLRLDARRGETLRAGGEVVGHRLVVRVVKNKLAAPHRSASVDLIYGAGLSRSGALIDAAMATGVLSLAGSWFAFDGETIAQGREALRRLLDSDETMRGAIEARLATLAVDEAEEAVGQG